MRRIFKQKNITPGVRAITRSVAIMWFGWGFAETLIPVLLFSFSSSYAEAGLLRSTFDIVYIFAVPIIGSLVDKRRATSMMAFGFLLYVFVGGGYYLAGTTGNALFIVIARSINGIAYALYFLARDAYFNRNVPKKDLGAAFGYFDTVANFWWMIAAISGMVLISYFSITSLLFLIIPSGVLAALDIWRFTKSHSKEKIGKSKDKLSQIFYEIKQWSAQLRLFVLISFVLSFASSAVMFFVPIQAHQEGASLSLVILLGVFATIPSLFGIYLGNLLDKKGHRLFSRGLLLLAILIIGLAVLPVYAYQLAVVFLISLTLELLTIGTSKLIMVSANPSHFGRVDGLTESISDIGSMMGPMVAGLSLDLFHSGITYASLACIVLALFLVSHRAIQKTLS